MKLSVLRQIIQSRKSNISIAVVTRLDDGAQYTYTLGYLDSQDATQAAVADAFRRDRSQLVEIEGRKSFIHIFSNSLRLLVVGAVHVAKPLIFMAQSCGYAVTLIDPRRAFASVDRFPDVDLVHEWPDLALARLGMDRRTAVVTLTHDPKLDEPALIAALNSEVFYIGALGSRRTHQDRCERLHQEQITEEQLKRIHAPIGLDIAAESPAEIAVSIMAEITQKLRQRSRQ